MQIKQVPILTLGMAPTNCDPSRLIYSSELEKNVVLFTPHPVVGEVKFAPKALRRFIM